MIPLPGTGADPEEPTVDDEELRSLLKRYAYAPSAPAQSETYLPSWVRGEGWALRGAAITCILFFIFGFMAGRNSNEQRFDGALLTALAYVTPWQLFVMAPTFLGENYVFIE